MVTQALALCLFMATANQAKKDVDVLQGTWKVIRIDRNGKELSREGMTIAFQGNVMKITFEGDERTSTFKLDEAAKPKAIDLTATDGPFKGKIVAGIYELKGDDFKFSIPKDRPAPRPTEFISNDENPYTIFSLKRVKKK